MGPVGQDQKAPRQCLWHLRPILLFLFSLNTILFLPFCDLLSKFAVNLPVLSAIDPGQAVNGAGNIDCTLRNTHPASNKIADRRALLHVFVAVIVLDRPIRELATLSNLQNLQLCLAFLAALPEPTFVLHLAANPFHPAEAPILDQWRCRAASEHGPSFDVSVGVGLARLPHQAQADHNLPGNGREKFPLVLPKGCCVRERRK